MLKEEIRKIINCIKELAKKSDRKKLKLKKTKLMKELLTLLKKEYKKEIEKSIIEARVAKEREGDELAVLSETIAKNIKMTYEKKDIEKALEYLFKEQIREDILKKDKRADGQRYKNNKTY